MKENQNVHWWSSPRRLLREILMLDDTPHMIALGTMIGMFIGMTPTVGIQMILVILFELSTRSFFRFNRTAALITVYVSNPLTSAPLYYFNYWIGTCFVGGELPYSRFASILSYSGFAEWWTAVSTLFLEVGKPLLVGSLIVGIVSSALTYPLMRWLLLAVPRYNQPATDKDKSKSEERTLTSSSVK
jgi:uncharacterized protein (DUF2062 family)